MDSNLLNSTVLVSSSQASFLVPSSSFVLSVIISSLIWYLMSSNYESGHCQRSLTSIDIGIGSDVLDNGVEQQKITRDGEMGELIILTSTFTIKNHCLIYPLSLTTTYHPTISRETNIRLNNFTMYLLKWIIYVNVLFCPLNNIINGETKFNQVF